MSDTSWPGPVDVADPFPDPPPAHPRHPELAAMIDDLWSGRATTAQVAPAMVRAGIDGPFSDALLPPPQAPWLALEADLVRISTDADPASGAAGPDLVLGPLADDADLRALEVAVALAAFFPGDGVDATPALRWARTKPLPSPEERASVRAIGRAPLAPWRVVAVDADRCELADVLGLSLAVPHGSVRLREPAFGRPRVGHHLLARVAHGPHGWEATCPIRLALPALPPAVPTWLRWLSWSDRLERPGRPSTLQGVLARRGHALARRLLEQAWLD